MDSFSCADYVPSAPILPGLRADYARDFEKTVARLRAGRLRIHIPQLLGLRQRRPGMMFHPTPELFIQTGGATDFVCPQESFRLGTGDVCIVSRGVPHGETPVDLQTPYGVIVCMHGSDGMNMLRARGNPPGRIFGYASLGLPGLRARDTIRYLDDIASRDAVPPQHQERYVAALVEAFLVNVLAEFARPEVVVESEVSPLVLEAEKLVQMHIADSGLTVARLASMVGCSADHLSRTYNRERGVTLSTWMAKERVAAAQQLLGDPRYNVAEVGWACGFNGASYFIRVFKEHTGLTPLAYRQSLGRT